LAKIIKIKCTNGINLADAVDDIFFELKNQFHFVESNQPDFILFGPYGNDIPKPGKYLRIGYFCENILPDFSICDYAFGIPSEDEIRNKRYYRIQWHGLNPGKLTKHLTENDIDQIINQKTNFCNFLYSNKVSYRETFFKQLSKYKKVDAPGKSMNNMPSIDNQFTGSIWDIKRQFLSPYKFTIAFENYVYPGYQTEKLYDAMLCNSLPIYCGDPNIDKIFNTNSFINVSDYLRKKPDFIVKTLERLSQQSFTDYRPASHDGLIQKAIRKIKTKGRDLKMKLQFNNLDFSEVIDRVIEIDKNQDLQARYLRQPWFKNNSVDMATTNKEHWMTIFNSK
jgi:hypothetical protein